MSTTITPPSTTDGQRQRVTPKTLDELLHAAIRAPSPHNTQPWIFALEPGVIELRADRTRALAVNDPDDRELTISCGAALFNLRVAAWHAGVAPAIELLPEPADPDLLATVRLHGGGRPPDDDERLLYDAIEWRHTSRGGFVDRALPIGLSDELRARAHSEGVWLELLDDDRRRRLAELIAEGDDMQWANRHWRRELAAWTHPRRTGDGVRHQLIAPLARAVISTLDIGMPTAAQDRESAQHAGAIIVLDTHRDRPRDWLAAGMALEHVLLHAASCGLQAAFFNQPIQVAELRMRVAALLDRPCFPQIIACLGEPVRPAHATPRRPLADVIEAKGPAGTPKIRTDY